MFRRKECGKSKIFIAKTDESKLYKALDNAFNYINIKFNFNTAAIKLNLCSMKLRETGATSDPIVVEQLVKFLNDNGVHVRLVESDSGSKDADLTFNYLGFKKLEKKYDVQCINLSKDGYITKKIDGYYLKSVKIPISIASADYLISHPKLKTHSSMKIYISGALKNQFGCLMKKNKALYHRVIHEVIADVNLAFHPDLTIMDSIIAMTGYGPTNGVPQRLNLLLTSEDPVSVDALAARIFRFNPHSIKYLKLSSQKSLGNLDYVLYGYNVENLRCSVHINRYIMKLFEVLNLLGISGSIEG